MVKNKPLVIGRHVVAPGERVRIDLPVALLPTHTPLHFPLQVLNGARPGPNLWLSAAIHGDEINGVEIIREVLEKLDPKTLRGAIIAAPIVNVFGFLQQSRYLPDRRDLNRSFPGSKAGSLAARVAHLFMTEIVANCTHGIDLHTGSLEKSNLPQIRANLLDPETLRCATAFGAPVMAHSIVRNGSLRGVATKKGLTVLVYEAGEAQRFNTRAIKVGVSGVLGVLRCLKMLPHKEPRRTPKLIASSSWVRARKAGLLRLDIEEGETVKNRQVLGSIGDPFGEENTLVRSPFDGVVIGLTNNPVVHGGDAIVHIGRVGTLEDLGGKGMKVSEENPG